METLIATCGIVLVLGGVTFLANLTDVRRDASIQVLLNLVILGLNFLVAVSGLLAMTDTDNVTSTAIGMLILVGAAIFASLLLIQEVREWIARLFPAPTNTSEKTTTRYDFPMMNTLDGSEIATHDEYISQQIVENRPNEIRGFRPESYVHAWAIILIVLVLGWQISSYFLAGGLSGVAEDIAIDYPILISNLLPNLIIPFIGVGLFVRRNFRESLQRLGLGPLSWSGLGVSLALSFGLLMMVVMFSVIWQGVVSPETFEEQTEASSALAESINSVGLAFMLAATAAIGEEIAFRGALQPVFGFWSTALIFAISHVQYTLTPASVLIFFVAIALGWVRRQFNTTTAILVHFLYNFLPLLLTVAVDDATASILRILF